MREALDRMRPLASDALLAMFQITMGESTEKAGERTLTDAAKPPRKRRRKRSSSKPPIVKRLRSGFDSFAASSVARSTAR